MKPVEQIKRLIALYAFALDDRDFSAVGSMLSDDCLMAVGENKLQGRDQIVAAVSHMQSDQPGRHLLGPSVVQLIDPRHASAWTDMVGIVPGPDGAQVVAGTWRYHDRLRYEHGTWVFTHRYLHTPAQPLLPGAPPLPRPDADPTNQGVDA
ncbi:MAG: nuclear transport factor 2 family protein [Mycobacteriaceae bacterium]